MKFPINRLYRQSAATAFILVFLLFGFACQKQQKPASNSAAVQGALAQSPTEAYKMIFNNVKAKQTAAVKTLMTEKTLGLAQAQAQRQNSPLEKMFENGFTATTFSDTMPEIRDERISGDMGAIEVYNSKDSRWEDLPFIKEKGGWKLAVGDIFAGKYKSPGKGLAQLEMEASNSMGNKMVMMPNINGMPGAEKMNANAAASNKSK
jgi:hypothetical protein